MIRQGLDYYPTGKKLVDILLENITLSGIIFEPCNGQGHISKYLPQENLIVNDISNNGWDAKSHIHWDNMNPKPDWSITNPPFNQAFRILCNAIYYSKIGVAFLLRLSFLEPTIERVDFLAKNPPNKLIILPRYSFTSDGKTDSVTCAWMIWDKSNEKLIKISRRL